MTALHTSHPGQTPMDRPPRTRAVRMDTHCHSKASSKPVIAAMGLIGCPESYSEPERVYDQAKARAIPMQRFHARKGDVLVWHADLPHGGSKLQREGTRRSLVTHFVPQGVKANYRHVCGERYHELMHASGHGFTARHHDLRHLDDDGRAPLWYDGGVTMRNGKPIGGGVVAHPESLEGHDGRAPAGGVKGWLARRLGG